MDITSADPTHLASTRLIVTLDITIDHVNAKRVGRAVGEPSPHKEPTELRRTFARNLRLAREAARLTQHGLATAASCGPGLIAAIETDAANMTLDTFSRLARVLGVAEIDLLQPNFEQLGLLERIAQRKASREPIAIRSKTEPTELQRRFAGNLRARRQKEGWFQRHLAAAAGIPLSLVVNIEVHCQNVRLDTVTRVAKALGCTEISLLGPAPADG